MSSAAPGKPRRERSVIGWREWVALPELGEALVKAKIDTGARTSSLHAFEPERFERDGRPWVRFVLHPFQRSAQESIPCEAEIVDERRIRSSSGHSAVRPVIRTPVVLGDRRVRIEVTLASRDEMGFRMLLGRKALRGRYTVDPGRSFLGGVPEAAKARRRVRKTKKRR